MRVSTKETSWLRAWPSSRPMTRDPYPRHGTRARAHGTGCRTPELWLADIYQTKWPGRACLRPSSGPNCNASFISYKSSVFCLTFQEHDLLSILVRMIVCLLNTRSQVPGHTIQWVSKVIVKVADRIQWLTNKETK